MTASNRHLRLFRPGLLLPLLASAGLWNPSALADDATEEPAACTRASLSSSFSGTGLRVLLLRPQVPTGKKNDAATLATNNATADTLTDALQKTLQVQLGRVAEQSGVGASLQATGPVTVQTLSCTVSSSEQARRVGQRLEADVVVWGMVGCAQKDPAVCAAPLQLYALEDPADEGVSSVRGTSGGASGARAIATARPSTGWLQLDVTAVARWHSLAEKVTLQSNNAVPEQEPASLDSLALPWLPPDTPGPLLYATAALGLRSQNQRLAAEKTPSLAELARLWDSSTSLLAKALEQAPPDNRPLASLLLQTGSARLLAREFNSPHPATVRVPGMLMPELNPSPHRGSAGSGAGSSDTKSVSSGTLSGDAALQDERVKQALDLLERAYQICDKGDLRCQSLALSQKGWAYMVLDADSQAMETFSRAIELNRRARDVGMGAVNSNHLALLQEKHFGVARALPTFQQALLWSGQSGDGQLRASILLSLARCYSMQGDTNQALDASVEARKLANRLKRDDILLRALHSIASLQLKRKNYGEVLEATQEAIPLAQAQREQEREVYLHALRAEALLQQGKTAEARDVLTIALSLARGQQLPIMEASILSQLGRLYAEQKDRTQAIEYLLQAQPLIAGTGDMAWSGANLQLLSDLESAAGKTDQALAHAQEASVAIRQVGDNDWLLSQLNGLATLYSKANQPELALKTGEEAIGLMGNRVTPVSATLLTETARIYRQQGNLSRAEQLYQQALPAIQATGDSAWEGSVLEQLVQIQLAQEKPTVALASAQKALNAIRNVRNPSWEKGMLEQISRIYFALEKDDEGVRYSQQAAAIHP